MYLPGAVHAVRLLFLASSVIASPLAAIQPRTFGQAATTSGVLRFGIELETILKVKEDGKALPHLAETLDDGKKEWEEEFELFKKSQSNPGGGHPTNAFLELKESNAYQKTFRTIRQFLVKEWQIYTEQSPLSKLSATDPEFKIFDLADRWGNKFLIEHSVGQEAYTTWSITQDPTFHGEKDQWQFPIEFVSPILLIGTSDYWYSQVRHQLEHFFSFLEHCGFEIIKNPSTSTHVHVSPLPDPKNPAQTQWTIERVQQMAWSAFFFEPAIDSIPPVYEQAGTYAKPWRSPDWIKHITVDKQVLSNKDGAALAIVKYLDKDNVKGIYNIMNPAIQGRPGHERYWSWNFQNLVQGKKGTIEFRKGAQSMNTNDAILYIEFVAGFTLAACVHVHHSSLRENFNVDTTSLYKFLYYQWPTKENVASGSTISTLRPGYQAGFKFPELEKRFPSDISASAALASLQLGTTHNPEFEDRSDASSTFSGDEEED